MSIKEGEIRAVTVQVCVNVVLLGNSSASSVVEQPHGSARIANRSDVNLVASARPIHVSIETIVEQIVAIASICI